MRPRLEPSPAMRLEDALEILRSHHEAMKSQGVVSVSIFGSVARGEAGPESDIDLLVEFVPGSSLFDVVGLQLYLEDVFGRKVDVATPGALRPQMRDGILADAVRAF